MFDALWTTTDLLVAATVAAMGGLALGFAIEDAVEALRRWWDNRRARNEADELEARLREGEGLPPDKAWLARMSYRRWRDNRCVFCGEQRGERPRCEAQVAYVQATGLTSWETSTFDPILDYLFGEDRKLEVAG